MKINHKQYAEDLVRTHGKGKAIDMMQQNLIISEHRGSSLTLFDEADFTINDYGKYEYSNTQGKKAAQKKDKRVRTNINFYRHILNLLGAKKK